MSSAARAAPDQDRFDVAAWRGLDNHVLSELDAVASGAVERGYMVERYSEAIRSRARCRVLRAEHGLGLRDRLR